MLPRRSDVRAFLGIGSNQGDRAGHLLRCVEELRERCVVVVRASAVYSTAYVGPGPNQPEYLNAVLEVTTSLDATELLTVTQEIERRQGRLPDTHMQPRTLDIDILFFGNEIRSDERLQLPHPRLAERRFVLEPLAELGVLAQLPVGGLHERLEELRRQQAVTLFAEWSSLKEKCGLRV